MVEQLAAVKKLLDRPDISPEIKLLAEAISTMRICSPTSKTSAASSRAWRTSAQDSASSIQPAVTAADE